MSMLKQVVKPSSIRSKNLKALLYGASWRGKTFFATNNKTLKTLVLDLEAGTGGLEDQDNVDVLKITSLTDFKKTLVELVADSPYDVIVVDGFTKVGEMLFVIASEMYPEKKDGMNLWGLIDTKYRQYYDALLKIDSNIIITALYEHFQPENAAYAIKYPMLKAKKFKEYLPSQVDLSLYFDVNKDKQRVINIAPNNEYFTKNRYEKFLKIDQIVEGEELFSFEVLREKILKSIKIK